MLFQPNNEVLLKQAGKSNVEPGNCVFRDWYGLNTGNDFWKRSRIYLSIKDLQCSWLERLLQPTHPEGSRTFNSGQQGEVSQSSLEPGQFE